MRVQYLDDMVQYNQRIRCKIVEMGILEGDEHWRYYGISSPFHRLYHVKKGRAYVRHEGVEHVLTEGHVYLIRRNTSMDYYAKEAFDKTYVHVNYTILGGLDLLENCHPIIKIDLSDLEMTQLDLMFEQSNLQSYTQGMAILYMVVNKVLAGMSESQRPLTLDHMPYHKLIEEMMHRLDANFSVEEMAQLCEQSVSDFSRKFKQALGMSPKAYLHKQLVEESKLMLLTSPQSVKAIASDLGYEDSLYFSRFFRKRTGMSPTKYRASQMKV